jgi:hypothetical protein
LTTGAPIAEEKNRLRWKMTKIGIALVSMLFLSLAVAIKPVAGGATVVKVDPSLIEYYEDATGQQFTVAIKIVDVTNLYGFDIKFRWNTTFLDYVNDTVHVPRNATYPDGVLYSPIMFSSVQVNATTGTYWIAYSSKWPAPSFNGSGTVFNMTLRIKQQPVQPQPDAHISLELYSTDLAARGGAPIPHTRQNGTVILHALVSLPGDLTDKDHVTPPGGVPDGKVDENDLWYFCAAFINYYKIHALYPECDFNKDGKIDEDDLWYFCAAFIDYWKTH